MEKRAFMLSVALLLHGCAYAISPDMAKQADTTVTFKELRADPERFKGKIVILGGAVIQTTALQQNTLIEVEEKPLDYWGMPKRTKKTGGRFNALVRGYLDPLVYAPGRQITVAAEVAGTHSAELGEAEYSDPVVVAKEIKLWPRERESQDKLQWMDPLYDPYKSPREY